MPQILTRDNRTLVSQSWTAGSAVKRPKTHKRQSSPSQPELDDRRCCLNTPDAHREIDQPSSARAGLQAAERPRHIGEGSDQRAATQREHGNTEELDFAMTEDRTCRYSA